MTTVADLESCKIKVFANDHNPPHFHVVGPNFAAKYEIADLKKIVGHLPRPIERLALDWAKQPANRRKLRDRWKKFHG